MYSNAKRKECEDSEDECCKNKTHCEKRLMFLLVLALVAIGFLGTALFNKFTEASSDETCMSHSCIQQSAWILNSLNDRMHPCDDFYEFACGRFLHGTTKEGIFSPIDEIKLMVRKQINALIKSPTTAYDSISAAAQKWLYRACVNVDVTREFEVIGSWMKELGTWPIVEGNLKGYNAFDYKKLIYNARKMGLKYDMFFKFSMAVNEISGRRILKISPPEKMKYKNDTKVVTNIASVAINLGANPDTLLDDALRIYDFHTSLQTIIDVAEKEQQGKNEQNIRKIGQMMMKFFPIPIKEIIRNITQPSYLHIDEDVILISNENYFIHLHELLDGTQKRIIANYMIWKILEDLVSFLNLSSKQDGCLLQAKTMVPFAVQLGYYQNYVNIEKRTVINEMATRIKETFAGLLGSVSWIDEAERSEAIEYINNTQIQIGAPSIMEDVDEFERLLWYKWLNLNAMNGSYLEVLAAVRKNRHDYVFSTIGEDEQQKFCPVCGNITDLNAFYLEGQQTILLPAAILQGAFFNVEAQKFLNYGGLGTIIGHELVHALQDFISQRHNESIGRAYEQKTQCFVVQYDNYFYDDFTWETNGSMTLNENVADYLGSKLAYIAYKNWVHENGPEKALPGLEYTPHQLFWYASVIRNCNATAGNATENDVYAKPSFRTLSPLRNSLYFNSDFQCPDVTYMNAKFKCNDFL